MRHHKQGQPGDDVDPAALRKLAQELWERDGKRAGAEDEYLEQAYEVLRPEKLAPDYREAGTSGHCAEEFTEARGLPPDPPSLGRPLTDDEKIDEAALQSMDASDPPAYSTPIPGTPQVRNASDK